MMGEYQRGYSAGYAAALRRVRLESQNPKPAPLPAGPIPIDPYGPALAAVRARADEYSMVAATLKKYRDRSGDGNWPWLNMSIG